VAREHNINGVVVVVCFVEIYNIDEKAVLFRREEKR